MAASSTTPSDAAYLKINPNGKVPTLVDGDAVIWESNTILRYLGNKQGGQPSIRADPPRAARWSAGWIGSSPPSTVPISAIFKEAKKPAAERAAELGGRCKELGHSSTSWRRARAAKPWLAGPDHAGRYLPRAHRSALPRFPDRAAGLPGFGPGGKDRRSGRPSRRRRDEATPSKRRSSGD